MRKLNLHRLFLVLNVVILLIISVSCSRANDSTLSDKENMQSDDEEKPNLGVETGELWNEISTDMTTATEKCETVSFRAEPYIQNPAMSWEYSLDIKIEDGKIYINDILYEESSSVPPVVLYSDGFLAHADYIDEITNSKIANTLTKIQNCESCYLLETKQNSKIGQKISVYEIDNVLYFIRFFDNGEVMRIHYAPIE